jgi:hypothetical protein
MREKGACFLFSPGLHMYKICTMIRDIKHNFVEGYKREEGIKILSENANILHEEKAEGTASLNIKNYLPQNR